MAEVDRIRTAYNVKHGSKKETLDKLNEGLGPRDAGRTSMAEVRKWYLVNDIGALKIQTGFNSYVPPSKDHEIQVDLFEYKYKQPKKQTVMVRNAAGKKVRVNRALLRKQTLVDPYGIIAINTFTKKLYVDSIKLKTASADWKPAMDRVIANLGKPKVIYTDPDSSLLSNALKKWFADNKIENVITRQHAAVAERAIRTIKKRLDDKLESDDASYPDGEPDSYWTKHIKEVVEWYNEEHVQANTNMKPIDAEKPENEFDVKTNLEINAIHRRKYPEIEKGDEVRTFRKKKVGEKERMGNFAKGNKTVTDVSTSLGQTFYKVAGVAVPFIRADLHLIKKKTEATAAAAVPAAVNEERNIDMDGPKKEAPEPVKLTPEETKLVDDYKYKKMNKKEKAKFTAKKDAQAEAEKIKEELARAAENAKEELLKVEKLKKKEEAKAKKEAILDKLTAGSMARTKKSLGLG